MKTFRNNKMLKAVAKRRYLRGDFDSQCFFDSSLDAFIKKEKFW